MTVFKCKMCGGDLQIADGMTVAVCDYCGTQQTLPKLDNDRKANLYDRANHFRRNNEFDKAMGIYEQILNEDKTDAEAYWSILLCRYGIEYVEDPVSRKRIPTVNRAQFTSIYDDEDYKSALNYADVVQKSVYESEAKIINDIQKGILAISQKEEPFDVFICYKESDNSGRRTQDSVIAAELYHELTREGYKVFFSRITLEDKLGTAYEPYIFAALNSAKVMVVLGTRAEYFNAVWVKNEWSRYLSLIKNGAKKILIPAYRDMNPYDLPKEFSHLQAQDMSKLGFMQDLIRGINKLVQKEEVKPSVVKETVVTETVSGNSAALLKRGFMALEFKDWAKADNFFEQVLNFDAECADAYLGKLMTELGVAEKEKLDGCAQSFEYNENYKMLIRFGDEKLVTEVNGYIETIKTRNYINQMDSLYGEALVFYNNAKTSEDWNFAAEKFSKISGWKDSDVKTEECNVKAKDIVYSKAEQILSKATALEDCEKAEDLFLEIPGWKDADAKIQECKNKAKDIIYSKAEQILNNAQSEDDCKKAEAQFAGILGWKDAAVKAEECRTKTELIKINKVKEVKKEKRNFIIVFFCIIVFFVAVCLFVFILSENEYNSAVDLMNEGKYSEAVVAFERLGGYKDSILMKSECENALVYVSAVELMEECKYAEAIVVFRSVYEYKDSKEKIADCEELRFLLQSRIVVGEYHTVGLKSDGTVVATGRNDESQCDVSDWRDIIAVSAGDYHTVGLKSDGTVVATGYNKYGQCDVSEWTDIVAISAGYIHTVGLKSDGTVIATGSMGSGQCNVSDWSDIISVFAGYYHTVGLKSDGTVVATGDNNFGQCNVLDWTDLVAVSAGFLHTVGLKSDGTVVAMGDNDDGQCDVSDWSNIVSVSGGYYHTAGLKSDGTVVTSGENLGGQRTVALWRDIVVVSAGRYHTVGLKSDGTVVAAGYNEDGQCNVFGWDLF